MMLRQRKVAVVVGGGVAGASCAAEVAQLCRNDDNLQVILVSASRVVRVATLGTLRSSAVQVSDEDANEWASRLGVKVVRGNATALNSRSITVDGCGSISFDVCCIATGARPKVPSGLLTQDEILNGRVLSLRDTDSISVLQNSLSGSQCVAVIGNGGIALELVHEITDCNVVWIVKDQHIGNAFFDCRGGEVMLRYLRRICDANHRNEGTDHNTHGRKPSSLSSRSSHRSRMNVDRATGTTSILGAGVGPNWMRKREQPILFSGQPSEISKRAEETQHENLRIEKDCQVVNIRYVADSKMPVALEVSNGKTIFCDYVVCGTGVLPNVEWIGPNSGLDLDGGVGNCDSFTCAGGVLVHEGSMQSCSRSNIFAAGDCATVVQGNNFPTCESNWFQMRLWSQAELSGRAAGNSMAAFLHGEAPEKVPFDLFVHSTRFFGLRVVLLGRYNAQGLGPGYRVLEGGGGGDGDETFVRVVVENGKVRGAILVGDVDLSETYENLILDRLNVGHLGPELVDPSIDLADYFD